MTLYELYKYTPKQIMQNERCNGIKGIGTLVPTVVAFVLFSAQTEVWVPTMPLSSEKTLMFSWNLGFNLGFRLEKDKAQTEVWVPKKQYIARMETYD